MEDRGPPALNRRSRLGVQSRASPRPRVRPPSSGQRTGTGVGRRTTPSRSRESGRPGGRPAPHVVGALGRSRRKPGRRSRRRAHRQTSRRPRPPGGRTGAPWGRTTTIEHSPGSVPTRAKAATASASDPAADGPARPGSGFLRRQADGRRLRQNPHRSRPRRRLPGSRPRRRLPGSRPAAGAGFRVPGARPTIR